MTGMANTQDATQAELLVLLGRTTRQRIVGVGTTRHRGKGIRQAFKRQRKTAIEESGHLHWEHRFPQNPIEFTRGYPRMFSVWLQRFGVQR